jgi:hypothetical protein
VPTAWCFASLIVTLFGIVLLGIEIALSPKAIYCQAIHLSRWFSQWPNDPRPPRAGALAMPRPEAMSFTDARSRLRMHR